MFHQILNGFIVRPTKHIKLVSINLTVISPYFCRIAGIKRNVNDFRQACEGARFFEQTKVKMLNLFCR